MKLSKPDYTKPNAYCPIALVDTISKVIESMVVELLSYIAELHQLIPPQCFGGRPGRTGEEAILILSEKIMNAWKERDTYSVIVMDVVSAFNNVHHKRLSHNLRKRKLPDFIVHWIESFLSDRYTQLCFSGVDSARITINAGVPQGSPISPILYLFYNVDLLEIPGTDGLSWGFIDDIAYGVQGELDQHNAKKLQRMLMKAEEWRE